MGLALLVLYHKFVLFVGIISFSLYTFILSLFRSHLFRREEGSKTGNLENLELSSVGNRAIEELGSPIETESKSKQDFENYGDGFSKKEETEFSFQFKFPSYEEFCKNRKENGDQGNYEFTPVEGFSGFIREPEILKITDDENNDGPFGDKEEINGGVLSINENYGKINSPEQGIDKELLKKTGENENQGHEDKHIQIYSESESISSSPLGSVSNGYADSCSDGFLSDSDFGDEFDVNNEYESLDEMPELVETETYSANEKDTYTVDELRKIEEAHYKNVDKLKPEFLSEKDFGGESETDSKKADSKSKPEWDSDELWEHQELIEQLKMELKKVRATGLPTILEESESSPKIAEDLKPWKIDEKFRNANPIGELHKLYKSYRDRMRKLDILNYQKMYAIGFLQLKDPLQSISAQKSSVPSVSNLLSHNLFPCKRKKIGNDPMMKFIVELQSDLEIVYVGHMCLSWEILHWQYDKALEMWESDPRGIRMYNEVAGDFQQFQVLIQRFIEDEVFQGPRVQNYVKSRCALRHLLQVPLLKEDNLKDRKKAVKRQELGDFAITIDTILEILEESIRIFWRFIRADKECSTMAVKSRKGLHMELQNPADSALLMEIQANLLKKEKKLKDLLRGSNCIFRKFKKREEDDSDLVFLFFSQVDMKLVGRVLNMPRITTDQLIWCRNKLQKISFVDKKIQVEPSFLLFPC